MSFLYPNIKSPGVSIDAGPLTDKSVNHKSYNTMINNPGPIPYSVDDSLVLHQILESLTNFLVPQVRVTWPQLSELFASNLDKLLISLQAYYDSNNPVIPRERLFDILCEKDAAKILKNIRTKSVMKKWNSDFVEEPDWWTDTPYYEIFDIGDIFYYKYCFFWEEENDDYKFQLQPVSAEQEAIDEFTKTTESVLDELNFDFDFEPSEILYNPRSSKVIDSEMKSHPDVQIRFSKRVEFRFGPRQPGKRCIIPVHPGGTRDTIINQIPDLNTILAIDKLVSRALKGLHGTMISNVDRFSKELEDFYDKYEFFYCRDIEKEGITKPRYLLKIMLKALMNRCPYFEEVCTSDFFDGDWCQIDDQIIHSERGHGLGMANSLTTLMQFVLFRMTIQRYTEDHDCGEDFLDFYALNDDCVYGINLPEDEAFELSQIDHSIMEELGLIRKKTKSFLTRKGFVFLEIYYPATISRKDSIMRRTMLLPYSAVNIVHAKDLMSLMGSNPYIEVILHKWGYEFYPDEINQPRHFGGWFSKNFYGLDISLDYDIEEFSSEMSRAAQAVLSSDKKFKRKMIKTIDPFNLLRYPDVNDYIKSKLPIAGSAFFSSFERLKIRPDFNIIYQNLYEKRQRVYLDSKYVDLKTFLSVLVEQSDRDIFISKNAKRFIRDFEIDRFVDGTFSDPYRYNYPLSSAIRKLKGIEFKGFPSSYWPITHSDSSFTCTVLRSEIAELNLDYHAFEYTDEDVVLPTDEDDFLEFITSWKNPVAVGKYCQLKKGELMIPRYVPESLKYKSSFFLRNLTRLEFLLLQGEPYSVIDNYLRSGKELQEFIDSLKELREESKLKPPTPHESEEDESSDNDNGDEPPDDFDPIAFIAMQAGIRARNFSELISVEDLPEGWDLESLDVDENLIYICENRDYFSKKIIDFVNLKYDNILIIYDEFILFMKYADPQSMGIEFLRRQLRILDRHRVVKEFIFNNMIENEKPKDSSEDDDEVEFGGDFDVF